VLVLKVKDFDVSFFWAGTSTDNHNVADYAISKR
jgi:hypothetical protein